MTERAELIANRVRDRVWAIVKAVPPIKPPPCYWFHSDATESYCRKHIIAARGRVFELGPPLEDRYWFERTEMEEAFFEDIGATESGESDNTEACTVCGETLSYILTDYGVDAEIDHFLEHPLTAVGPEQAYALDRLSLNVWAGGERKRLLGIAAVINQAHRIVTGVRS